MSRSIGSIDPTRITQTSPLRLEVAASLAYPDGSMTANGLRTEAARGNLRIEKTAGRFYTTLADIERMRERCRVQESAHAYGSAPSAFATGRSSQTRPGSFSTEESISPRDALMAKLRSPNSGSQSTSRRSTSRSAS
ncbi:Excisionase [Methylorubrum extorquens DM4]|uniref:Excisionase n=1 Tax=Methylorubrum extorquens (strain DSM 6343 / CIP 106787 / DM4) TaxID=661410 RepID=C7CEN3_METED|nr:Excisionase [Methylorubrum extorquens DM4]